MKNNLLTITCAFMVFCHGSCVKAQEKKRVESTSFRDSIITNYVKNGAWLFPITYKEWGMYIDSALLFLPHDAYLWQQKGMPYFKQMKYELGLPCLDSAVKYDAKKYLDYRAFNKCIFQKNYESALIDFINAKKQNGNFGIMDHPYNFYIGLCHLQLNHFDTAKVYFQQCVNEDATRGENWIHPLHDFYLGVTMYEIGDYKNAIEVLNSAIKNYTHFSDAKLFKALCFGSTKQYKQAINLCQEADADFKAGYTINEDNAKYEKYPYQIDKETCNFYLERFSRIMKLFPEKETKNPKSINE